MNEIEKNIDNFYKVIRGKKPGGSDTRYKSWEYCHKFFYDHRENADNDTKDLMALHLAFYLASWGMYRGSTYLLQRDYKAHLSVVDIILEKRYESLWNFDPTKNDAEECAKLLFGEGEKSPKSKKEADENGGVFWRIKYAYSDYEKEKSKDEASDTLITKILMGTFACIPAFDRFLKKGIDCYFGNGIDKKVDYKDLKKDRETFCQLSEFVEKHHDELKVKDNNLYTPMKCFDMFLWQIGKDKDEEERKRE